MKLQAAAAALGVAALLPGAGAAQPVYQTLVEHGVRPTLIYDGEGFADLSGGARRGETYLGNLNLLLTLDMERLGNWRGATFFLDGLAVHGGRPSRFAGDAQGVSSIEAAPGWRLEEAPTGSATRSCTGTSPGARCECSARSASETLG